MKRPEKPEPHIPSAQNYPLKALPAGMHGIVRRMGLKR